MPTDWPERTEIVKMAIWIHHLYFVNREVVGLWLAFAVLAELACLVASSTGKITYGKGLVFPNSLSLQNTKRREKF